MKEEQKYFNKEILDKAVLSGQEYGWHRDDFVYVITTALSLGLGIIGGQVQFKLPDGTCELYWHNYDTSPRLPNENWEDYCLRTYKECLVQFEKIPSTSDLIKEGIENFKFLKEKSENSIDIEQYLILIAYFDASETDLVKGLKTLSSDFRDFRLKIVKDSPEIGWYLYVFDKENKCIADYLQNDLFSAMDFAEEKYGVPKYEWK